MATSRISIGRIAGTWFTILRHNRSNDLWLPSIAVGYSHVIVASKWDIGRLDYRNTRLAAFPAHVLRQFQSLINTAAAARLGSARFTDVFPSSTHFRTTQLPSDEGCGAYQVQPCSVQSLVIYIGICTARYLVICVFICRVADDASIVCWQLIGCLPVAPACIRLPSLFFLLKPRLTFARSLMAFRHQLKADAF